MESRSYSSGPKWSWLLITVAVTLGIWSLNYRGGTAKWDASAYDLASRGKLLVSTKPAQVLLVYANEQDQEFTAALEGIIQNLLDLGTRSVGITFAPHQLSEPVRQAAREDDRVVLGWQASHDPNNSNDETYHGGPQDRGVAWGLIGLGPSHYGVHREQLRWLEVDGLAWPTLEGRIEEVLDVPNRERAFSFGVDFSGPAGSLPHVDWKRVLQSQLIPELVRDKIVLIGPYPTSSAPGIATPTTDSTQKMSQLEFHGHAVNTLLTRGEVHRMRRLYAFPTYFLLAAFVVLAYLRSRMRTGLLFFCTGAATTCVIAFLCLTCLRFWIPCVSLVLVQMTSLVMVLAYKYSLSYSALQRTLLELSVVIRKRRWPTNFYASDEPWHQILTLLRQVFDLERLIILELPAKDVYVKEVCALNCSLDDINERRRDHRRWPFVAATENRGPLRVSENGHQLFKGSPLEEQHFLSPLIFGGEVFGFLAVGVLPLKMTQDFELRLRDFSNELGELLYRRRWVQADRNQAQASVNSLVRIPEVDAYSELIHATHLLERRLDRLENMFQASETAAAIYDIFGRLLMVNERMVSILQSRNVTPSETTTIDLIALLTGWHLDDCRHLLRRIVLDKDHESIPVVMPDDSLFVLSVRPLQLELPQSGAVGTDPHPHLVSGIHCELSDRSNFRTTFSAGISTPPCEQTILGHLDYAEELLDGLPSSNDIDTTSVDPIKGHQTGVALKSTTRVSVVQLIQHIFQQQQKTWQSRGIDFQIDGEIELGRVDVAAFEEVLQAIIEFILHDARDLTTLRILLRTVQNQVIIDLCNEGFGYDTDEIASVRHESFQTNQEVLRRLRSAVQTIEAWGCALHITSELGVGTSCSLKLNREQV